jgi:hypothetical protein
MFIARVRLEDPVVINGTRLRAGRCDLSRSSSRSGDALQHGRIRELGIDLPQVMIKALLAT